MILPDFILPSRQNQVWDKSGIDSYKECKDKKHFKSYPYKVEYRYNSRGFRDAEWPDNINELQNAIWCVGDSFTVGIGSPLSHTWVNILQSVTNKRCINVSMDGASNKWIARKVNKILDIIKPSLIIIQWSYISRDELDNTLLSDEERRLRFYEKPVLENDNLLLTLWNSIQQLESSKQNTNIIHSFIPYYVTKIVNGVLSPTEAIKLWNSFKGDNWPDFPTTLNEFNNIPNFVIKELGNNYDEIKKYYEFYKPLNGINWIPEIEKLDSARDGHHYDVITATDFVEKLEHLIFPLR